VVYIKARLRQSPGDTEENSSALDTKNIHIIINLRKTSEYIFLKRQYVGSSKLVFAFGLPGNDLRIIGATYVTFCTDKGRKSTY
jgi:hypothetical protein